FAVIRVEHYGINNLPNELAQRVEGRLGHADADADAPIPPDLWQQARATGYANHFRAIRKAIPWRPELTDATGSRFNPRPTAAGAQAATVVGPSGATAPSGADALYTDRLGRGVCQHS